jgi:hypothetical protein
LTRRPLHLLKWSLRLSLAVSLAVAPAVAAAAEGDEPEESEPDESEPEESEPEEPQPEDPLSDYRTPFDVLAKRTIGTTSKPVEFNWRRTTVHVAAIGDHLFELNNFNSLRSGVLTRFPSGGLLYELGLTYVWVWDTPSSKQLAYTPYRQPGRPDRLELDFNVGVPLAEGVVTTAPRWFPAVELVFNAYFGVRYSIYPGALDGMKVSTATRALLSPALSKEEKDNLEDRRLQAMEVDSGRYGLMMGVGNDIYFKQGVFFSPRVMFALPLLAPATETDLLWWADLSLAVGVAF